MGGALKSEIRKIFTTRMWWGMLLGMILIAALLSMLFASLVGTENATDTSGNPFRTMTTGTAQLIYSAGINFNLSTLIPLALGVMLITNEYRHKTISATFLATPSRWTVLISKIVALIPLGIIYGIVHDLASVAGAAPVLASKSQPMLLDDPEVMKTFGLCIVAFTVWLLLGFGFGMLVRNQVAAVMTAVGASFILHIALNIFFTAKDWTTASKFLPGNLTSGMLVTSDPTAGQQTTQDAGAMYFDYWWQSAGILLIYALVLAGIGAFLTTRRDIT